MATQFEMQKKMVAGQKGSIVYSWDGQELDAQEVKNGSGGKRGHRAKKNKLTLSETSVSRPLAVDFDNQMQEALKQSLDDAFLASERKNEIVELENSQALFLSKNLDNFLRTLRKGYLA